MEGLSFLQSVGFCHTRFSESQVLADLAGNVKICEFGLSIAAKANQNILTHARRPGLVGERGDVTSTAASAHTASYVPLALLRTGALRCKKVAKRL